MRSSDEKILKAVENALEKLDEALSEVLSSPDGKYNFGKLGPAIGMLREFQDPIYERNPGLRPPPPWEGEEEPSFSNEDLEIISQLSQEALAIIDNELLLYVNESFQKVAKIVASFMAESNAYSQDIPPLLYAQRIEEMVKQGLLDSQGNLKFMCYSEVRLLKPNPSFKRDDQGRPLI